jgi:hypothetical protein
MSERLTPDPRLAGIHGLDFALISDLEERMAEAYDSGIVGREALATSIRVVHEALGGGALMDYLGHVKTEAIAAVRSLPGLDPRDHVAILRVQMTIDRFEQLIAWMEKFIAIRPQAGLPDTDSELPEDQ